MINDSIRQWGKRGETLVFIHYFGGSATSWKWLAEQLKDTFRCISITLPGFGGTPPLQTKSIQHYAVYVQDQLNALAIDNYQLVGHSMGAKIAMQLAANAVEGTVQQLVLIAPSPPSTEPMADEEKKQMLKKPDRREAERTIAKITMQPLQEDQYALAVEDQLGVDEATRQWWLLEGMEQSIVDSVQSLHLPISVIASEDDPAIAFKVIRDRVVSFFVQSKLLTIRNTGHLIPMESVSWLAENIRRMVVHQSTNTEPGFN